MPNLPDSHDRGPHLLASIQSAPERFRKEKGNEGTSELPTDRLAEPVVCVYQHPIPAVPDGPRSPTIGRAPQRDHEPRVKES